MRHRRFRHWLIAGLAVAAVGVIVAILPLLPAARYWGADDITRAGLDTERKLAAYERSGNPGDLCDWLTNGPAEALRQQIYVTLGQWSIAHRKEFVRLVESLDTKQQEQFIDTFAFALDDSGQSGKFRRAFKGNRSAVTSAVTRRLGRTLPWSDYLANPSKHDSRGGTSK